MFKSIAVYMAMMLMASGLAQARPFTAKDLALLDRVSDPRISPDARFVAYNLRSTDWDGNHGVNALWVIDRSAANSAPRLVRDQEKSSTAPRWSADGQWLYFLSSRSGSTQVWRTAAQGGESWQVTKLPLDVSQYRLAPDGHTLVAAINAHAECDTLACSKAKDEAKAKEKTSGTLYDTATPRFWDTYLDGRYIGLFAVRLSGDNAPTDAVPLTRNYQADIVGRPDGDDSSFVVAEDGSAVIFSARPSGSAQGLGDPSSLYTVPLDGSKAPQRLDPAAATSDSTPAISPDGAKLAYLAHKGSTFTAPRAQIMIRDLKSGSTRPLAESFDRSPGSLKWSSDSKTLYAGAEDTGQERIFAVSVASGAVKPLTGDGHVGSFDLAKGVIVYSRDALDSPAQVYDLKPGEAPHALTHVGQQMLAQTPFSSYEAFSFSGWNDETVHGYVVQPANYHPGQKYPVAFLIHGGPHGSFGNAWSYRWNPQVWAGMGYAVVMVDFHGSSGYGEAFAKSIVGHWGDRPLTDLQKGWSYALSRYSFLDADRACALGGSYGGYMVAWIAGNWTKPWKCLVNHDGVFDIRLMSYSTDIPGFQQSQNDAPTWEKPEAVERFNPIDHVADWSVPMLVVHGGRDDRVPLDQGMGAYGAAQLRHIPSQLLYFPDENHWVLKPQNSVQWYTTVEAWMKRWLGS
ncbi:MAG TPA: S9 family peptidase [Steroidobacteraceae bacterium]|nr:S9 family peptidase [Steroidobacteraceae bacterium]